MSIENILSKWSRLKQEIKSLQKEEEDLKNDIHRIMNIKKTNTLVGRNFTCSRKVNTRRTINKDSVPNNVWMTYSNEIKYPCLNLKKNK